MRNFAEVQNALRQLRASVGLDEDPNALSEILPIAEKKPLSRREKEREAEREKEREKPRDRDREKPKIERDELKNTALTFVEDTFAALGKRMDRDYHDEKYRDPKLGEGWVVTAWDRDAHEKESGMLLSVFVSESGKAKVYAMAITKREQEMKAVLDVADEGELRDAVREASRFAKGFERR